MADSQWQEFAQLFELMAAQFYAGWQTLPAPAGSLADPAVEQACDEVCRVLARDPLAEIDPPAAVKPWLMARLSYALIVAQVNARDAKIPAPKPGQTTTEQFLIHEWHGAGRRFWSGAQ